MWSPVCKEHKTIPYSWNHCICRVLVLDKLKFHCAFCSLSNVSFMWLLCVFYTRGDELYTQFRKKSLSFLHWNYAQFSVKAHQYINSECDVYSCKTLTVKVPRYVCVDRSTHLEMLFLLFVDHATNTLLFHYWEKNPFTSTITLMRLQTF